MERFLEHHKSARYLIVIGVLLLLAALLFGSKAFAGFYSQSQNALMSIARYLQNSDGSNKIDPDNSGSIVISAAGTPFADQTNTRVIQSGLIYHSDRDLEQLKTKISETGKAPIMYVERFATTPTPSAYSVLNIIQEGTYETSPALQIDNAGTGNAIQCDTDEFIVSSAGDLTHKGKTIKTPTTRQTLQATHTIAVAGSVIPIRGDGAPVTLTSTPSIAAGTDGQIIVLVGTGLAVTIQDESKLSGSTCYLNGETDAVLAPMDTLTLTWSTINAGWIEISRSVNTR